MDDKTEELKKKFQSNAELVERLGELTKFVRMGEASINVDQLNVSKVDCKVMNIIFAEMHVIENAELFPDKANPQDISKLYMLKEKK